MKKVLVIDDNKEILDIIHLVLEMEGYQVRCLQDGSNLLNTVFEFDPNLILLDVMLGDLDGRAICRDLKTNSATNRIPIIMISASHIVDIGYWLADDFVSKPFNIDHLAAKVSKYVA